MLSLRHFPSMYAFDLRHFLCASDLFRLWKKCEGSQVMAGRRTLNPAGSARSMDHARYQCFVVNPRGTYRLHGTCTCLVNISMMYSVPCSYSSYLSTIVAMTCTYTIEKE